MELVVNKYLRLFRVFLLVVLNYYKVRIVVCFLVFNIGEVVLKIQRFNFFKKVILESVCWGWGEVLE